MYRVNKDQSVSRTRRIATGRRAFTMVELLVASVVVAMIVGAMGMMALGVRTNQSVSQNAGMAQQHARVVLNRIRFNISSCTANETFPGFMVFSERLGPYTYPDTLVVWKPSTTAADPDGLPRWDEVIIYAVDPDSPDKFYEITVPGNATTVPALTNLATWQTNLLDARRGKGSTRLLMSDLLHFAKPASSTIKRGALRFDAQLRPSADEWDSYVGGTLPWSNMNWVQDVYSPDNGLRQNWCRIEMQLRGGDNSTDNALPFVTSATVYFQVKRP
jgi:prepilin-type N-terminal cleavage/methylation domain-containing protein